MGLIIQDRMGLGCVGGKRGDAPHNVACSTVQVVRLAV
jgi:hypothetical protein